MATPTGGKRHARLDITKRENEIYSVLPENTYWVKQGATMEQHPSVTFSREEAFCDTLAFTYRIVRVSDNTEVYRARNSAGNSDLIKLPTQKTENEKFVINNATGIYSGSGGAFLLDNISPVYDGPYPQSGYYAVEVEWFTKLNDITDPR